MFLLVAAIKGLAFKFNGHNHPLHTLHNSKRDIYNYNQKGYISSKQYLETFNNKFSVIESYCGVVGTDLVLAREELAGAANLPDTEKQAAAEAAKIKYLQVATICRAD